MHYKKSSWAAAAVMGVASLLAAGASHASQITFQTASSASTSGGPVSASAVFTLSSNSLQIQLTDGLMNPTDVAQLVSGLSFTLSNGLTSGSLSSSSADFINVSSNGSFTNAGTGSTGWILNSGSSFDLCDICQSNSSVAPSELIIGPPDSTSGTYSNANGSITNSASHQPFINGTGTYTLDIQGLTASDSISNVVFRFGTTYGTDTVCAKGSDCMPTVPEPGALALFAAGLAGLGFALSRRRRAARER